MANLTTVTRPYARAVLEIARSTDTVEHWSQMLQFLSMVVQNPVVDKFVRNLAVASEKKAEFINTIDGKILNSAGKNLIKILAHYKRLLIIPELARLYEAMREELEHERTVELFIARETASQELELLRNEIAKDLKVKLTVEQYFEPGLIGGGKLVIGDRVLESSIRGNLKALYEHLTQ
jgi:F-type H+-transporting ATPase subunit delta